MKAIKNILVPVDFSDNSKAAYADFVTVVTKYRSFWQRFIHVSMTKQLTMYANIPVLVVHVNE